MTILKDLKPKNIIYQKGVIDNYNVIINAKDFYEHAINSDIKRYEEIRKLITGQDEDYTTGCLWDYDYIKNHSRLIAVDLRRQKELCNPKVIQEIEFVGQLKIKDGINAGGGESWFILKILVKIQKTRFKFSQGSATVLKDGKLSRSES